jgi:hypothetical protein
MSKKDKKKTQKASTRSRLPYEAPDFINSLAFERQSLACAPASRNASPVFPASCSMQS